MTPSQVAEALAALAGTRRPVFVWGAPGISKSDTIRQVGQRLKRKVVDIRAVLLDPVDLRGIPHVNGDGRAHWCPPAFLPHDPADTSIVFLDELPQAAPSVQAACLQLTLDRRIGEYVLPEGCTIFAAGNEMHHRAGTQRMITPLCNRFIHLHMEVSHAEWAGDRNTRGWAEDAGIDHRVLGFIRFQASALFDFDPKRNDLAFPTPRSWHAASDAIKVCPPTMVFDIVKGCVGEGAAAGFASFCENYAKLPKIADVMKDPAGHPLPGPDEPSVLFALSGSLVEYFKTDAKAVDAMATVIARMPPEFAFLTFRGAAKVNPEVAKCQAGAAWRRANGTMMLDV